MNMDIPEKFNAAAYMLDRHIEEGRGGKQAIKCLNRSLTYLDVFNEVNRFGNVLLNLGVEMENRVVILSPDSPELICSVLAAMKIGAIPIVANTMLPSADLCHILNESRAKVVVVFESLAEVVDKIRGELKYLKHVIVIGKDLPGQLSYEKLVSEAEVHLEAAETYRDDAAVWQYSSGTTGVPKGIMHMHKNIFYHFKCYAEGILHITDEDRVFSIAKLFFGYGQGNSLYWPFCAGAATVLLSDRPDPEVVAELITKEKPTIFCGVPTSYNAILQLPDLNEKYDFSSIRICTSAGEALPAPIFNQWLKRLKLEIIDGIGSTECFHIFASNRPGKIISGSPGQPVSGFKVKIVDDEGIELPAREIGNLMVAGGSNASGYWNKHDLTTKMFHGPWVKTGDKCYLDEEGFLWFAGRSDDMIKAGGIWVSPIEVEGVMMAHPAVLECGVIGSPDKESLFKPKAFVVLREGFCPSPELTRELQQYVKDKTAPYKYPRWIEYVTELPKTTTGKLQRFRLRQQDSGK